MRPMNELRPSMSRDECRDMCEELGLVDTLQHGDTDYIRITQKGIDALCVLLDLLAEMSDPDVEPLKAS